MSITFNDRVAIDTGAGGGLGRCHALDLARRGAKVVVNDLGGNVDGSDDGSVSAAEAVVEEIKAAGGEAMANGASVTDRDQVNAMVEEVMSNGRAQEEKGGEPREWDRAVLDVRRNQCKRQTHIGYV